MLVGRTSLDANEYIAICQAANDVTQSAINRVAETDKLIPALS